MSESKIKVTVPSVNAYYVPAKSAHAVPTGGTWNLSADSDVVSHLVMHSILDRQTPDMFVSSDKTPGDAKKAK